jgi:hypothetical protein
LFLDLVEAHGEIGSSQAPLGACQSTAISKIREGYLPTQDHLGSANVLTDSAGTLLVNESFASYGARRSPQWQSQSNPSAGDLTKIRDSTRRGFTGHTMLDKRCCT